MNENEKEAIINWLIEVNENGKQMVKQLKEDWESFGEMLGINQLN